MKNTSLTQRPTTPTEPSWQPLNDFAEQKQNDSGLKAWLAVVEGCIRAIEKTAWQGREIADQTVKTWKAMGRGANAVNEEMQILADEMRRWMRDQREDFEQYVSARDAEF